MMLSVDAQMRLAGADLNGLLQQMSDARIQQAAAAPASQATLDYVASQLRNHVRRLDATQQRARSIP